MIYVALGFVAVILIYIILVYNSLVALKNKVLEAFSTMDIYLKKRWDLVPNLVEIVKAYAGHEKEIFQNLANLRASSYDDLSLKSKISKNMELTAGLSRVFAVVENYPELKASENFSKLSQELTKIEDDIANSRKYYNGSVKQFNIKIMSFPSNIIAKLFGFEARTMFEAKEGERTNVEVSV